jgi:hypothetical protein
MPPALRLRPDFAKASSGYGGQARPKTLYATSGNSMRVALPQRRSRP